jgi:hypothetical protein
MRTFTILIFHRVEDNELGGQEIGTKLLSEIPQEKATWKISA